MSNTLFNDRFKIKKTLIGTFLQKTDNKTVKTTQIHRKIAENGIDSQLKQSYK
jgi:hypothetical protein